MPAETMRAVRSKSYDEVMASPSSKKKMYPIVSFDLETLPEGKDWPVGKTYTVTLQIKKVGGHFDQRDGKTHGETRYEIHGIKTGKPAKSENPGGKRYARY